MQFTQVLKSVLRLVGLGAEPADSAPMVLSSEVQRTLSILMGKKRQSLIPYIAHESGAMQTLPVGIVNASHEIGASLASTIVTLSKPADLLEITVTNDYGVIKYGPTGSEIVAHAVAGSFTIDAGVGPIGFQVFRIVGPITKFQFVPDVGFGFEVVSYTASRFNHGRE